MFLSPRRTGKLKETAMRSLRPANRDLPTTQMSRTDHGRRPSRRLSPPTLDRLFVPLASAPFAWFQSGKKRWELRRHGRQYTSDHVCPGRAVELRRGYSDPDQALWGIVADVHKAGSLEAFFRRVPRREVLPEAGSYAQAFADACRILGIVDAAATPVLGFQVALAGA